MEDRRRDCKKIVMKKNVRIIPLSNSPLAGESAVLFCAPVEGIHSPDHTPHRRFASTLPQGGSLGTELVRTFIVTEGNAGTRTDKFLAEQMPEYSRSEIQKFEITKNGAAAKLSEKTKLNDEFIVTLPAVSQTVLKPEKMPLDILFEDDDIIIINKSRGVAMHPGAGRTSGTLVQGVLSHCNLSALGGNQRPGVVHRLDMNTSGVVVLAKSDAAFRELTKMFSAHDLIRQYVAFVWGVPNWEGADIEGNIARSVKNRQKMTMVKVGGKPAKTHADVMNVWPQSGISELKCTLFTGRTHQIRVHLSAHGFPVMCDPVYGNGSSRIGSVKDPELLEFLRSAEGQMLHAAVLELKHPITGEQLRFKSKLPEDMLQLRNILNG
jgi:23S rRNA pseudouridine1911/1915/1917 synthase